MIGVVVLTGYQRVANRKTDKNARPTSRSTQVGNVDVRQKPRTRGRYFETLGAVDGSQWSQDTRHTQNLDNVDGVASENDKRACKLCVFVHT